MHQETSVFTDPGVIGVGAKRISTGDLLTVLTRGRTYSLCLSRTGKALVWVLNSDLEML